MSEWLPMLLGGPILLALLWRRRPTERAVRSDLRARFAAEPVAPVTDAGTAPVFAVARALELDASELDRRDAAAKDGADGNASGAHALIRSLGLDVVELVRGERASARRAAFRLGRTEMAGTRHGRRVVIRLDDATSAVEVSGNFPVFSIQAGDSGWGDLGRAPRLVAAWVEQLVPSVRWNGVVVDAGEGGLVLHRPDESTRSWMHDLWLAEQLADAAACSARARERDERELRPRAAPPTITDVPAAGFPAGVYARASIV